MSSSAIQPLSLGGISQYASDFQSILNRAVSIASIPVQQLQNEQTTIQQQAQEISSLSSSVSGLSSALSSLATLGSSKGLVANSSDTTVVSAQATGAAANTSYTISNVTSVASAASESSLTSYPDATTTAVSTTGDLNLTVGSNTYAISLSSAQNNLSGLKDAINNLNAGVTAQILTTASGDYLSVSANNPGANTLQLVDDPSGAATQLLTNLNQGSNTVFQLNGINVSTPSTNINNIIPGVTFQILGTTSPNEKVTITLSSDRSQLSSALQTLVNSYNSVAQGVDGQSGAGAGSLSGNSIIWQLRSDLLQLSSYTGSSGSIRSLADLGITFDQTGQASFDSSQVSSLSDSQLTDALSFLGSATTGLGKLGNLFSAVSDPVSGAIAAQTKSYNTEYQRLSTQISRDTDRINTMQSLLKQQLSAADAHVATLQSQQNLLTSSIQSLQYSTYGQQILSSQGV